MIDEASEPRQRGRLIVVCGLPGAGKTTHAKRLCAEGAGVRLCPDEWMEAMSIDVWDEDRRAAIESLQWDLAQQLIAQGLTAVIEWGTWARSERDTLREGARAIGATAELHFLRASPDVLYARVSARGAEDPPITREDLVRWHEGFQEPGDDELSLYDLGRVIEQG